MIDDFAKLIPGVLLNQPGAVFYSGRLAFSAPSDVYVVGLNPGGDPVTVTETAAEHTHNVLMRRADDWTAYVDDAWRAAAGDSPLQRRVRHLLANLGRDPRRVPASNLIFARTRNAQDLAGRFEMLADLCWPFHAAVIGRLGIRVIPCFGAEAANAVRHRLGAHRLAGTYEETNRRKLVSAAYLNEDGVAVVRLPHPGRFNWCNPKSDPSGLVAQQLRRSASSRIA